MCGCFGSVFFYLVGPLHFSSFVIYIIVYILVFENIHIYAWWIKELNHQQDWENSVDMNVCNIKLVENVSDYLAQIEPSGNENYDRDGRLDISVLCIFITFPSNTILHFNIF